MVCVFAADRVVGAADGRLDVAEHRIHPVKLRLLKTGFATASLTTELGVVKLHQTLQRMSVVPFHHHLHQFGLD